MKRIYLVMASDGDRRRPVVATAVETIAEEIAGAIPDAEVEPLILVDEPLEVEV